MNFKKSRPNSVISLILEKLFSYISYSSRDSIYSIVHAPYILLANTLQPFPNQMSSAMTHSNSGYPSVELLKFTDCERTKILLRWLHSPDHSLIMTYQHTKSHTHTHRGTHALKISEFYSTVHTALSKLHICWFTHFPESYIVFSLGSSKLCGFGAFFVVVVCLFFLFVVFFRGGS